MGADANGFAYALDNRYNSVNPLAFWSGVIIYYPWIDSRLTRCSNYSHHRAPRQWRPHDLATVVDWLPAAPVIHDTSPHSPRQARCLCYLASALIVRS
jgi:hypothetical protein